MPKIIGAHTHGAPIGTILPIGMTSTAFTLPCDGSAVSRTTYPELFLAIGTNYGAGDGSTTFNVPLLSGVALRASGSHTRQTFTITSGNATAGAVYSNNSQTFTVLNTISASTTLICSSSGAPSSSGTLTKVSGIGDATITFSSVASMVYSATHGQYQNDQMQGHRHSVKFRNLAAAGGSNWYFGDGSSGSIDYVNDPTTDGTNGTPRTGTETRMANAAATHVIVYR